MIIRVDILCPSCGKKGTRIFNPGDWEEWMNYCPNCSGDYHEL